MKKQVLCLHWEESILGAEEWSLHFNQEDVDHYIDFIGDFLGDNLRDVGFSTMWVFTTDEIYNRLRSEGSFFVERNDFIPIQLEMFGDRRDTDA